MPVVPTHLIPFRDACDAFLRSGCIPPPEKHELKDLRVLNISLAFGAFERRLPPRRVVLRGPTTIVRLVSGWHCAPPSTAPLHRLFDLTGQESARVPSGHPDPR